MKIYKHYLVYKTTQLSTGKYYIGQHCTNNIHDSYLGSGADLKEAVKKYGREDFKREILYDFDSLEEMNKMERTLVTQETINNPNTFNLITGGRESWNLHHPHSDRIKEKIRQNTKFTDETLKKISWYSSHRSKVTKKKLAIAAKKNGHLHRKKYKITYNDGRSETITGLAEFCKINGYNRHHLNRIKLGKLSHHKNITKVQLL